DLDDYDLLMIPGGFAAGDYVRAGTIFAARLRSKLSKDLVAFVRSGKPIFGVCNGFQVLVEAGLLPALGATMTAAPEAVLATNEGNTPAILGARAARRTTSRRSATARAMCSGCSPTRNGVSSGNSGPAGPADRPTIRYTATDRRCSKVRYSTSRRGFDAMCRLGSVSRATASPKN